MAIDFNTDIVTAYYAGKVATDAAYESPGTFGLPTGFGSTAAEKRVLCIVELLRAFMAECGSTQEAKLLGDIMGRMMAAMKFGSTTWNTTTMPADAQEAALRFIAHHVLPSNV